MLNNYWTKKPQKTLANLRDLIAATDLVILYNLVSNNRFSGSYDLEFKWMNSDYNVHLFYATLSFVHHFTAMAKFKLEL